MYIYFGSERLLALLYKWIMLERDWKFKVHFFVSDFAKLGIKKNDTFE